jgi:hypothetical protein
LIDLSVGGGGSTVKVNAVLEPPGVVSVTLVAPSLAFLAIAKVDVIVVVLTTVQALGVTPALATMRVQGATKLAPVKVTGTAVP